MTSSRRGLRTRGRGRGLHAPAWLEELVRTGPPAVPWRDVVRFAVAIPAPLAVAVAVEGGIEPGTTLSAGTFGTMGALVATLAPQAGPLREKLSRTATATAFGAVGLLAGGFATGGGWEPVVVVALISVVAAGISAINATMSLGSLQLLIYTALASGFVTSLPWQTEIAFFLLGAAWATLATLVQTRTEVGDPDRAAVAAVFTRIADLLEAGDGGAGGGGAPRAHHRAQRRLRPRDPQPQPPLRPGAGALRAGRGAQLRRTARGGRGGGRPRPRAGRRRRRRRRPCPGRGARR